MPNVNPEGKYSTEQNNANSRHNNTLCACKEEDLYRNDSLKYEKREVISLSLFKASVFYSLVKRLSLFDRGSKGSSPFEMSSSGVLGRLPFFQTLIFRSSSS